MNIFSLVGLIAAIAVGTTIISYLLRKPDNIGVSYLRNFLGVFFIFSGVVKAIDPIGTQIKMEDYFSVFTEHFSMFTPMWDFFYDYALILGTFLIILEIVLGFSMLLGSFKKLTLWLYLGIILFFTVLTGFTFMTGYVPLDATFFEFASWTPFKETQMRVTDCGCFGDFVKLEPYESFLKDVVLTVLIVAMFFLQKHIYHLFSKRLTYIILGVLTVATTAFSLRNIYNLPIVDFRAYKAGTNIDEGRFDGTDGIYKTIYVLENESTGESKRVDAKEYSAKKMWEDKAWKVNGDKTEQEVVKEGKLPTIKDFMLMDADGNDKADSLLAKSGFHFIVAAHNLKKSNTQGFDNVANLVKNAKKDGVTAFGVTAGDIDKAAKMANNEFEFYNLDATPIKTMIRANPGVVLLKDGVVMVKYHHRHLPTWEAMKKEFNIK